jgi:hypothetical protein
MNWLARICSSCFRGGSTATETEKDTTALSKGVSQKYALETPIEQIDELDEDNSIFSDQLRA